MRQRFSEWMFYLALFLLPWQTRYIVNGLEIGGQVSEYGLLSFYVVEILIVVAFVLRGRALHSTSAQALLKATTAFIGVAFFSLALSNVVSVGWFHLIHLVTAFLLFSMILDSRTSLERVSITFALGLVIPALLGVWQVITGGNGASTFLGLAAKDVATAGVAVVETQTDRMLRAYGSFPHPNIFGGYLAAALMLLVWRVRSVQSRKDLWVVGVLVVILSSTLIMTFSRGAWFGFLAAAILLVGQMLWARKMPPSRAIPLITLGLVTVLITMGIFHNQLLARFNPSLHVESISIEERASQYGSFNDVFFSSSLIGVGPGAYVFALAGLDPGHEVWSYQPIHNTFLLVMAELGIVGFLVALRVLWLFRADLRKNRFRAGGIVAVSLLSILFVAGMLDHYFWSLWPGMALSALVIGCAARYSFEKS